MNAFIMKMAVFAGVVCATISVRAGLDPIRPACIRSCVRAGGDPQVCHANCWYCNAHNSFCPEFRYFCGYQGSQRVGWLINLTTGEARKLGARETEGVAYRADIVSARTF